MICAWFMAAATVWSASDELDQAISVLSKLDSSLISAEYRDEELQAVIDDLGTRLPAPVHADWKSLFRLGITPDDRISLRLGMTRASSVLAAIAMTAGDDMERPVFESFEGQIVLTTTAGTTPMRLTDVYDVRDLLANEALLRQLRDAAPPIEIQADDTSNDEPGAAKTEQESPRAAERPPAEDAGNPGLLNAPPLPDSQAPRRTPGEELLLLITDHVDPEAWMNFGGDRGLITEFNGALMVTATPSTHRRFRQALTMLRAANPTTVTIDASIIDVTRAKYESLLRQSNGNAGAMAGTIVSDSESKVLWRSSDPVMPGATLEAESSTGEMNIRIVLTPSIEHETGVLHIVINASSAQGTDRRSVKTSTALTSDQTGAIIELPAAGSSKSMRLLVLTVQRR